MKPRNSLTAEELLNYCKKHGVTRFWGFSSHRDKDGTTISDYGTTLGWNKAKYVKSKPRFLYLKHSSILPNQWFPFSIDVAANFTGWYVFVNYWWFHAWKVKCDAENR